MLYRGVAAAAVRLAGVFGAATASAARRDAADRPELHACPACVPCLMLVTLECTPHDIVLGVAEAAVRVYSPLVLRLWGHPSRGQAG